MFKRKNQLAALAIACILTISIGYFVPSFIDRFNDNFFGRVTILENPPLVNALKYTQDKGVVMCIHGYNHEDFSSYSKAEAKATIEKCISVFEKADLVPVAFLLPYIGNNMLAPSAKEGIESTGMSIGLPFSVSGGSSWGQYGDWWRNMTSFNDPRYEEEYNRIMNEQPTTILLHAIEWNSFLKQLVCDYIEQTNRSSVIVRVDDVEVNTPTQVVYNMTELLGNEKVQHLVYGVIPAGTWRGGDPVIFGISVNTIMRFYWVFFLLTAFFPLSFFSFWRLLSYNKKKTNSKDDPTLDNPSYNSKYAVSVIVPAYNEEKNIAKCIEAILKQSFKGDLEVIVVNDGSTDGTAEITSRYPVKLINLSKNLGKANALNIGIKNSHNSIIVFSDSDSQMSTSAVNELVSYLNDHVDLEAVAGNVFINISSKNFLHYFQVIEYRTEQEISRYLQSLNGNVLVCPGPLFAVRRHVIEKIMFENRTVIEDSDFTVNMLERSLKVGRAPEAKVFTNAPPSISKWFIQRKRWWYGNLQIWRIHKKWAKHNPWATLNYFGFINSLFSLILMLLLPYLFFTYDNITLVLLRGMAYILTPIVLFTLFSALFFIKKEKKLIAIIPIYSLVYATIKVLVVTYLYLRYLTGRGVKIIFGPQILQVK